MKSVALVTVACAALSWMLPVAAPQAVPAAPAPWLTMSFPYRKSDRSTRIWLKCSPREGWRPELFYFYWRSEHSEWTQLTYRKINLLEVPTSYLTKQVFACLYQESKNGRRFHSPFSNEVAFSLSESPPPATLSPNPHYPFYIPGEEVTLTCSAADAWKVRSYTFYKHLPGQLPTQLPRQGTGPAEHLRVEEGSAAFYSCTYWVLSQEGNEIQAQQSNIFNLTVRKTPPAPQLSVAPWHSVYTQGESIRLNCSVPEGVPVVAYAFYQKQDQWSKELAHTKRLPYTAFGVDETTAGNYSCTYWLSLSWQTLESSQSSFVSIAWTETPAAANLSVSPGHSVYIRGENITLTCSAPTEVDVARYTFYRKEDQVSKELQRNEMGPSETFRVDETASGNYSCAYWLLTSGRELESSRSSFSSIAWTDPPPPPVLTVDPPSGELREGDRLLLSCSADGSPAERRFRFFKDGAELASSSEDSLGSSRELGNASTALRILQAELHHTGEFGCRYEENVSGRWILSLWSPKVDITVSAKWTLEYLCFALVLLLLLIPLGVCFWRKRNGAKQKTEPEKPAQDVQDPQSGQESELTYALLDFPAAAAHSGREGENRLRMAQMRTVVYSEVKLPPPGNRAAK
ncbi:immunoglobulin superfamily member 1-like [Varanus komodoensis]|uniref:immunoglobulin superfamily member 1-like n=1 Tax=Varanus komodoensis TaxID=61221 RepID=UPI001CF7A849|nr:immunoglobulin superfamily member 1-like [Varanus komodoensis]